MAKHGICVSESDGVEDWSVAEKGGECPAGMRKLTFELREHSRATLAANGGRVPIDKIIGAETLTKGHQMNRLEKVAAQADALAKSGDPVAAMRKIHAEGATPAAPAEGDVEPHDRGLRDASELESSRDCEIEIVKSMRENRRDRVPALQARLRELRHEEAARLVGA